MLVKEKLEGGGGIKTKKIQAYMRYCLNKNFVFLFTLPKSGSQLIYQRIHTLPIKAIV